MDLSVQPPRSKRILITGVSRFWGANLARQLEKDHSIEFVAAVDSTLPTESFDRVELIRGDIRHSAIERLLEVARIDTVVHTQIYGADRPGESSRNLHDMNVIGTMNLMAACAASPYVRRVIVRSSTSQYGSSPKDPSFFREDMAPRKAPTDIYSRDIKEVETYVRDLEARAPHLGVTILRFANSIGEQVDTALLRYLRQRIVPTYAGYDPLLQFVTDVDAVAALAHGVRNWKPGTFNIAGPGTVELSRFLRMSGNVALPVLPPAMGLTLSGLSRVGLTHVPVQYRDLLRFGRGVDTSAMIDEFGFIPEYSTPEAAEMYAGFIRVMRRGDRPSADSGLLFDTPGSGTDPAVSF